MVRYFRVFFGNRHFIGTLGNVIQASRALNARTIVFGCLGILFNIFLFFFLEIFYFPHGGEFGRIQRSRDFFDLITGMMVSSRGPITFRRIFSMDDPFSRLDGPSSDVGHVASLGYSLSMFVYRTVSTKIVKYSFDETRVYSLDPSGILYSVSNSTQ